MNFDIFLTIVLGVATGISLYKGTEALILLIGKILYREISILVIFINARRKNKEITWKNYRWYR
jgi:hypothetical protein